MKSEPSTDTLVPLALLPELHAAADAEHRAPSELVGEAIQRYLSERRWLGHDDVPGKIAQGLEFLAQGRGLDGEDVIWPVFSYLIVYNPVARPIGIARVLYGRREVFDILNR